MTKNSSKSVTTLWQNWINQQAGTNPGTSSGPFVPNPPPGFTPGQVISGDGAK